MRDFFLYIQKNIPYKKYSRESSFGGFPLVLQGETGNRQKSVLATITLHGPAGIRMADHWKRKGFQ